MTEELKNKENQKKTEKRMPNFNQNLFPNYFPNQPPNINNIKPNMNRNVNPNMNPNFIHNFNPLYQIGMPPFNMPNNSDAILRRCECGEPIPKNEEGNPQFEFCLKCGKKLPKKESILNKILKLMKIMIGFQIMSAYNFTQFSSGLNGPMYPPYPLSPPYAPNPPYPYYPPYPPYPPYPLFPPYPFYPPYPIQPMGPMTDYNNNYYNFSGRNWYPPYPGFGYSTMGPYYPPYSEYGSEGYESSFPDSENKEK